MEQVLRLVAPVMAAQQALITLEQFERFGGCRRSASRLIERAIWERIDRGLYGPAGVPMTWHRQMMAAVLVAPVGSLISHRAGATLLRVGGLSEPVPEISIPAGSRLRRRGVIVHESTDLHLADRIEIAGIPTTGPLRLAMDLGGVMSERRYRQTMRELRHGTGVRNDDLLRTYLRHKRQGRNGGGALRDWLDRYYALQGVPESGLELVVLDAIIDAGLPAPIAQWWVQGDCRRYRLDLAYPDVLLAIEVDGSQHDDGDVQVSDRQRSARLRRAGWTVERVRSATLATDLARVLQILRRHFA